MLQLPVLPLDWYQGPIRIVAVTTEGGTVYPIGTQCPGMPISAFRNQKEFFNLGIETLTRVNYRSTPFPAVSINDITNKLHIVVDSLHNGDDMSLQIRGEDLEYYATSMERLQDVPGELVDASLFLDPENTTTYKVFPRIAGKAFDALADAGRKINNGQDVLESLVPFLRQYGFPRDGSDNSDNSVSPGVVLSSARYQALLAFVCKQLWDCIERKDYRAIYEMAETLGENGSLSFLHLRHVAPTIDDDAESPFTLVSNDSVQSLHQIKVNYMPHSMDSVWKKLARNWLYNVSEHQISSLLVKRIQVKENSFTIGVQPGGLQSAMWLYFAEKVYRAVNPHEGMRQCKQGGKFHGCGEWYMPQGLDDRSHYCPACRTKAGAERVARLRNRKQKKEASN